MSLPKTCDLSTEEAEKVTNCMRCENPLRGGYATHGQWRGEKYRVVLVQCHDCAQKERYEEYKENGIITARLLLDAFWLKDAKLFADIEEISLLVKRFEKEVWFSGLQKIVRKSRASGMSVKVGDFEMMTFCSAGRCMITMQKNNRQVTAITAEDEDESRMGLQGITATKEEGLSLVQEAIDAWKAGHKPTDDKKVGLG